MKKYVFFVFLFLITGFAQAQNRPYDWMLKTLYKNSVPFIKVTELKELTLAKNKPLILDTREATEYNISHIPGARYVGYNYFQLSDIQDIPKNWAIIVYCSVGYRSERIGEKLKAAGYKDVKNLYGGIFEWANMSYPMQDKNANSTQTVHGYSREWGVWVNGNVVYP
ncbi:MAG: rhodanese-like domain-containing protein [Bacteroidia bacterium]|nr:rhodanese-like domain-containing protein [Bacteroidia bacterium]